MKVIKLNSFKMVMLRQKDRRKGGKDKQTERKRRKEANKRM